MKHIFIISFIVLLVGTLVVCSEVGAGYYYFADHAKYSGNPVFPAGDDDWDYDKHFPSVIYNSTWPAASQYRMWYGGVDDQMEICTCYAYSASGDEDSWVKPNLGLFEYEGSSDNNIVLQTGKLVSDAFYDDGTYVLLVQDDTNKLPTTRHAVDIYTSSHQTNNFTLVKELPVDISYPGIYHGMAIDKRSDGRWYVYYQYRDASNYRSIGAYLSDSTDLAGDWSDLGVLIPHNGPNEQRYSIDVFSYDGRHFGAVLDFNVATDLTYIDLWDSEDFESWRYLYNWIDPGDGEVWDCGYLNQGEFVDLGDSWRYYYSGAEKTHSEGAKKESAVGYVHNATATPNILFTEDEKAIMTHDGKYIYIG